MATKGTPRVYLVHISYKTDRRPNDRSAYRVTIGQTGNDVAPPHDLRQLGVVWNGVVEYLGVYETEAQAATAVRAYVGEG
jgi:hypothetical protein